MKDRSPNLFALPPGVDFAQELVRGLDDRVGSDSLELARTEIWVNTERTRRRLVEIYAEDGPRLLPRIRLVGDLREIDPETSTQSVSATRRRLDLLPLVARLLQARPEMGGEASALDLTESLALLFTEMADEGVTAKDLAAMEVREVADYWQVALQFLEIAGNDDFPPEHGATNRIVADKLAAAILRHPPGGPIVLAGSTGSRGPVSTLMQALLQVSNGYVVLPGFDFHMPGDLWNTLSGEGSDDHPQRRFQALFDRTGLNPANVSRWTDAVPANPSRNALISLALRPAPVTDGWMRDGPRFEWLNEACETVALIEADSPRSEATAIAMALREAVARGKRAALVTPDRRLARRVTAALDYWRIRPDDSAGVSLAETDCGRLAQMATHVLSERLTSESLIAILGNPVTAQGEGRLAHLTSLRDLELHLRDKGIARPTDVHLKKWAGDDGPRTAWVDWVSSVLSCLQTDEPNNASKLHAALTRALDLLARGPSGDGGAALWAEGEGEALRQLFDTLSDTLTDSDTLSAREYGSFLARQMALVQLRDAVTGHPGVMIWGTLEARVQSVDLAILAGLNEGTWPGQPDPDPWLSRDMRRAVGLPLPERRTGLAAHDFQSAAGARELILSRAIRDEESVSVPSRWLNRLTNLLAGLTETGGPEALLGMRQRGAVWTDQARALDLRVETAEAAPRPAPAPPVADRPTGISLTRIKTLVRDPYAVYAEQILGLRPLNPLRPTLDYRIRGTVVHKIFEEFIAAAIRDNGKLSAAALQAEAERQLANYADWPADTSIWAATLRQNAESIVTRDRARWRIARPGYVEAKGKLDLKLADGSSFTITGKADRLDLTPAGQVWIYDYKTGSIPGENEQTYFDRQIYILGLMAEAGAFVDGGGPIPALEFVGGGYLGVWRKLEERLVNLTKYPLSQTNRDLIHLLSEFRNPDQGYSSRSKMKRSDNRGDYDHLARLGEWDEGADAIVLKVGR